jgi:hypothetical protein
MQITEQNSSANSLEKILNQISMINPENSAASVFFSAQKDFITLNGVNIPRYTNEFWTSKQRQGNAIHEISYRACFKPQLPSFFIKLFTIEGDIVYDPFSGRGTTILEAALQNRNVVANDINPLSTVFSKPRLSIPELDEVEKRLNEIQFDKKAKADIDISMFYHRETEAEIVSLRNYLRLKKQNNTEDFIDEWIRMVATNRLTGHSANFFSVYTLPPNQAISAEKQKKINEVRNQKPVYKDVKKIILKKSKDLSEHFNYEQKMSLKKIASNAVFLNQDARFTKEIDDNRIKLTVTSPPFLDVVQYDKDNWLRCWFNNINLNDIASKITMTKKTEDWTSVMKDVFMELFRITKKDGWVAFEVGEVRNGKIKLDEFVVPLGIKTGFVCEGVIINQQNFTKTANIWGVNNNTKGTNSNRIVLFHKK